MKEQVSVDENGKWPSLQCLSCNTVKIECEHVIKEFKRLKRLDENVKRKIAAYEKCVNGVFGKDYLAKIELLKSLYDEEQER
jgi:hypothetical protein